MKKTDETQVVSIGNGLYAKTRRVMPESPAPRPARPYIEYCEECRCYHERPTWPTPHTYRKGA